LPFANLHAVSGENITPSFPRKRESSVFSDASTKKALDFGSPLRGIRNDEQNQVHIRS
jgi:hypothetical protein